MRNFFITYFLFGIGLILNAQPKCHFKHYSTDDGLSHGSVVSMLEDSRGYMWFCTWDGLNRFDGYNFKTFKARPGDNLKLSSNRTQMMIEDKWGCIWIITYDSKIHRINIETERFDDVLSNVNDSLTGKAIQLFKASNGDVWINTEENGVYRCVTSPMDLSVSIQNYTSNKNSKYFISGNHVSLLFEDENQNIWLNTDNGVNCLEKKEDEKIYTLKKFPQEYSEMFSRAEVTSYLETPEEVFLSQKDGGLLNYNLKTGSLIVQTNVEGYNINVIKTDDKGQLYLGTEGKGLIIYDVDREKIVHQFLQKNITSIYKIYEDEHGLLWFETEMKGVVKYDPEKGTFRFFTQDVDVKSVLHIISGCQFVERNNTLWMSLKGGGFGYYNRKEDKLEYFYNKPGSANWKMSNFIPCYYIDDSGVIWISTYKKGIEKITILEDNFHFTRPNPLSKNELSNEVRALFEDHMGVLWVGTKSGNVYLMDKDYNVIQNFSKKHNLQATLVYSIIEDDRYNIWLGTKGNGVFKVERQKKDLFKISQFKHDPNNEYSLSNNNVYSLVQDSKGRIWVGTYGGGFNVLEKTEGEVKFKNPYNYFKDYPLNFCFRVRQIKEDNHGNIWLATTEGLVLLNTAKKVLDEIDFRHFQKIPNDISSLGNNDVYCIFSDSSDSLWFGTLGGGLHQLKVYPGNGKDPVFKVFTKREGLASDVIFTIEEDENNNLWMSSENGLIVYDRGKELFKNYNEYDGLYTSSFSEATSYKRKNGDFVFGAYEGLFYFKPEQIKETKEKLNLEITRLRLFNDEAFPGEEGSVLKKSISHTKEIVLKYDQNTFSFEYAGLGIWTNKKIKYKYILEGFDKQWHQAYNQNIATYTKVPPGNYTFKVDVSNEEFEVLNDCYVNVIVKNPLWKTFWAYLIYLILFLIVLAIIRRIVVTMIKLRNRVVVERELTDLKTKFFTNISHELRTPLTLIQGPVQEIYRNENLSPKGKEYIQLVNLNTGRMLRLVNQLLDLRKIQKEKLKLKLSKVNIVLFVREIFDHFKELAVEKNIDFTFSSEIQDHELWVDEEKMDIIIFNILSNAFKFTEKGQSISVELQFLKEKNQVHIIISDKGIGIPKDKQHMIFTSFANIHDPGKINQVSTGIGLSLSKELTELHNGTIYFESTEGQGTTFYLDLKTGKDHFDQNKVTFIELAEKAEENIVVISEDDELIETDNENTTRNKREQLLLVEDNYDLRKFIKDQLSSLYDVEEAENGLIGYNKAKEIKPLVIVSDVMMPELDGLGMIEKLKGDFSTSHIPVILLTAKSSIESRVEGLKYGADAYITKPFNSIHLKAQIDNLIHQRRMLIDKYSDSIKVMDVMPEDMIVADKDGEFLQKTVELIESNISDPNFKVDTISKAMGMGRTNFFNKIKGLTSLSPIDFIKEYRLNKAVQYLKSGTYNISEASFMSGFNDPGYFSKCFKEKFGVSPSRYLKDNEIKK